MIITRLPVLHIPYIQGYAVNPILVDTPSILLYLQ
jgi:hypothetical protein